MKVNTKYKVEQVVKINTEFYQTKERIGEQYQLIKKIRPGKYDGACLSFVNGDECHEKHVKRLTKKEMGLK